MTKFIFSGLIITACLFQSCATSMTPSEVNNNLPNLTKSKMLSPKQAEEDITSGKCVLLVNDRGYVAPIGLTTMDDLKKGARGIDEWVKIDGGNAYRLSNYEWVVVDNKGATQLRLKFNTLLCK